MIYVEIIAFIFSLLCVFFAFKENILTWPTSIIGATAYFILFFDGGLYSDSILQIIFFVQGILGWIGWKTKNNKKLEITRINHKELFKYLFILCSCGLCVGFFFEKNITTASYPYADAFLSCSSLVANYLLIKKKIESWIFWIFINIGYITIFILKEYNLSALLYFIFLILAIKSLYSWYGKIQARIDSREILSST